MKYFLNVVAFIIVMITAMSVWFLLTHVILDIAGLYQLSFITGFSFAQIYCTLSIIGLVHTSSTSDKSDEKKTFGDGLIESFGKVVGKCMGILFSWWVLYLLHGFLI